MKKGNASDLTPLEGTVDAVLFDLRRARGAIWGMWMIAESELPDGLRDLEGIIDLFGGSLESHWKTLDKVITELQSVMPGEVKS